MEDREDALAMALAHSQEEVEDDEPLCEILPPSPEADETEKANEEGEGEGYFQYLSLGYNDALRDNKGLSVTNDSKVAGLRNLGNTCFLNAVLQCLTYTPPLVKSLNSTPHKIPCMHKGFCAFCALRDHINKVLSLTGGVVEPSKMVANICNLSSAVKFEQYQQQDAHEYIQALLEALENSELSPEDAKRCFLSHQDSLVQKLFGGKLKNQIKCQNCSHCLEHSEDLRDLCLSIKSESLIHSLKFHFSVESIQSECEKCELGKLAFRRTIIDRAPEVLIIQLKRFMTSDDSGSKINGYVFYPQVLDLNPFVNSEEDTQGDLKYELYGVIVHSGSSMYFGHYYSFVQTAPGVWHELNDSKVKAVDIGAVLHQQAYILFYFRQGTEWFPFAEEDTTKLISMESPRSVLDNSNANNDCDSLTDKDPHRSLSDGEKEPYEQSSRTLSNEKKKSESENDKATAVCPFETSRMAKQEDSVEGNKMLSPIVDMQCKAFSTDKMQKEATPKLVVSSNSLNLTEGKRTSEEPVSTSCKSEDEETSNSSKRKQSEKCVDVSKHSKKIRRQVDGEMPLSTSGVTAQRDEETPKISRKTSNENMANPNVQCSQGTPNSINKVLNHMPVGRRSCLLQFVQSNTNCFQTPKKEISTPHSRKKRNSGSKGSVGDKRQKQNATENKTSSKGRSDTTPGQNSHLGDKRQKQNATENKTCSKARTDPIPGLNSHLSLSSEESEENLVTLENDPYAFDAEKEQIPKHTSNPSGGGLKKQDLSSSFSPANSKKTPSDKSNSQRSNQRKEEITINIAKHRSSSTEVVMTYAKSRHLHPLPYQLY